MDLIDNLISLGLTTSESKIYLALMEIGEAKTGKLCDRLDIPNSHIYRQLDSLIKKGLVNYKFANNVKIFQANDPESLSILYENKRNELAKQEEILKLAIPKLRATPKEKETISDYKYFEGISGIKAMWLEMNQLLIPNTSAHYYTGTIDSWKTLNAFYLDHHKVRASKKIFLQMILPINAQKEAKQRKKTGFFDYKFLDIQNDGEFGVYENFIVIQYTSKKEKNPRGFLIKDKIFVNTYKEIFERLWKTASA
jgi:sugar-specific transcriptional regulator TrmB